MAIAKTSGSQTIHRNSLPLNNLDVVLTPQLPSLSARPLIKPGLANANQGTDHGLKTPKDVMTQNRGRPLIGRLMNIVPDPIYFCGRNQIVAAQETASILVA